MSTSTEHMLSDDDVQRVKQSIKELEKEHKRLLAENKRLFQENKRLRTQNSFVNRDWGNTMLKLASDGYDRGCVSCAKVCNKAQRAQSPGAAGGAPSEDMVSADVMHPIYITDHGITYCQICKGRECGPHLENLVMAGGDISTLVFR